MVRIIQLGRASKDKGLGCVTCIKSGNQYLLNTDTNVLKCTNHTIPTPYRYISSNTPLFKT